MSTWRKIALAATIALIGSYVAAAIVGPATAGGETPKAWGVGTTEPMDDFTGQGKLLSKRVKAPGNGVLVITGNVGIEDDCSLEGLASLGIGIRVDGDNVWSPSWAFQITPAAECAVGPVRLKQQAARVGEGSEIGQSGSVSAVVPVSAGSHVVQLRGTEMGNGSWIGGRGLSILFLPAGSAQVPWPGTPI